MGFEAETVNADGSLVLPQDGSGNTVAAFKIGDGVTPWNNLPYASGPAGPVGPAGAPSTPVTHTHDVADLVGILPYENGGTGNDYGSAISATRLAASRTLITDLNATAVAVFNGTANVTLGVRGTLPVARGGTGATSAEAARVNLGISAPYEICEFYFFRHPDLRSGFQPAQGGLLANAALRFPEAWDYLQTIAGSKLCKTEAEWQAMTQAIWHTNADGTVTVGWNGIGGAPYYVVDTTAGTLRLPDLRGMYAEAAGYDSLTVGGVHGDGIPDITGRVSANADSASAGMGTGTLMTYGAFARGPSRTNRPGTWQTGAAYDIAFASSQVVQTANKVQPRAWGALACVYLGGV